jgi:glycosyltransferase A (GT-A) superfamily protein (DUF2064 family)
MPRPGEAKPRLAPQLGAAGRLRLTRALIARAGRWAAGVGPTWIAYTPGESRDEVAALAPAGARLVEQEGADQGARLERAFAHVAAEHGGPVIVIGTDQPLLGPSHAWAALDDLRDGVDVCLGPATSGGYYLIAARELHPALFAIDPEAWGGPRVMALTLEAIVGAGLSMGWLRSERDLDGPADAAALLADPCAPEDIVAALRPES